MTLFLDQLELLFSDLHCHLKDTGIGVLWLHCVLWLYVRQTWMVKSGNFSVTEHLPLIQKDSLAPKHGLAV